MYKWGFTNFVWITVNKRTYSSVPSPPPPAASARPHLQLNRSPRVSPSQPRLRQTEESKQKHQKNEKEKSNAINCTLYNYSLLRATISKYALVISSKTFWGNFRIKKRNQIQHKPSRRWRHHLGGRTALLTGTPWCSLSAVFLAERCCSRRHRWAAATIAATPVYTHT